MFHVIVTQTVSKHRTVAAARKALRVIKERDGEIAMVVEMPDEKREKK